MTQEEMKTFSNYCSKLQEDAACFKTMTGLSVEDFIKFFQFEGRYPTKEEIPLIRAFGIGRYLEASSSLRREMTATHTRAISTQFEKLEEAKESLAEVIKTEFRKIFNFKTKRK